MLDLRERHEYQKQVDRICCGITANIAEYAVMVGIPYRVALLRAETEYLPMIFRIRATHSLC